MEDLFECSVCMEPFENDGDKFPRVFPCQHTFCHSCINQIVKKNSVSCPSCRRKHKCAKAENMPKNLTLLQFMETKKKGNEKKTLPKKRQEAKHRLKLCSDCKKQNVFCSTCRDVKWCRECMRKNMKEGMASLEATMDGVRQMCSSIAFVEENWKEAHKFMTSIVTDIKDHVGIRPGYTYEVDMMCGALLESHERYFKQDFVSLQDAIQEFYLFRRTARIMMKEIKTQLDNADPFSWSMDATLVMLRRLCSHHTHRLAEAKAVTHWRSYNTYRTLMNLGSKQVEEESKNGESVWAKWHKVSNLLSFWICLILLLSVSSIAAPFLHDWFCTVRPWPESRSGFCSCVCVLKTDVVTWCIVFTALLFKLGLRNISASIPPPYVPKNTRQKLQSFAERYAANGMMSSMEFMLNSDPYFGKWMPPEAREALNEVQTEFMRMQGL